MQKLLVLFTQAPIFVGGIVSFLACLLIILTQSWHGRFTFDILGGIQKFHHRPTPRVGGLALLIGFITAVFMAPPPVHKVLLPMLIASLPAYFFGFAEDLTKNVGVKERLFATMMSGFVVWYLSGVVLDHVDVWGLDYLLRWTPFAVLFTAFAVGGVANSINIIDGMNGLASGVVMVSLSSLGWMSYFSGDIVMAKVCLSIFSVTGGFWLVNFPWGRIFLGDGGAYLLGFLLAWTAVLVTTRNADISPWASFLACAYPIIEVCFSVSRRLRRKMHPGHPDRLHLHSLIKLRISRKIFTGRSRTFQNASVSPIAWSLAFVPGLLAVVFKSNTGALIMAFCACIFGYQLFYLRLVRFGRRMR